MIDLSEGERIIAKAFAAFNAWCEEHDPGSDMDVLEAIDAYSNWCKVNQP